MSKEPIIIDDVDVSGCEFYINSKNLEFNCKQTPQSYFCKNQPNCYYKQKEKYKNALKEIREIAESRNYYPCSYCIKKEILQKCEVLKDE